ncbi:hypothetical protein ACYOEI_05255 [Singulisphaera rosea]
MTENQVLMISNDTRLVRRVREDLDVLGGPGLHVVEEVDRAFSEAIEGDYCLVIAHLDEGIGRAQFRRMLGEANSQASPVSFLALSETYLPDEANILFRLGIADYLSRDEHLEKIANIINALSLAAQAEHLDRRPVGAHAS